MQVSSKRFVHKDLDFFDTTSPDEWEEVYGRILTPKYKKNTRNFSRTITGKEGLCSSPTIYVIPRVRGGASYKSYALEGISDNNDVQYCPISKGFSMQDVSSFTLGPIVGEGLCLVNAAFSKAIHICHLQGGKVDYKRKDFWIKDKKKKKITFDGEYLIVDGEKHDVYEWLSANEKEWRPEWERWRRSIALCSEGSFHWGDNLGAIVAYATPKGSEVPFQNFVVWKWSSYILPSLELTPETREFKFMKKVLGMGVPIGLVHPKGENLEAEKAITKEELVELFNDPYGMCCQPYVVAYALLKD